MNVDGYNLSEREREEAKARAEAKIVAEVTADFERRREQRRSIESGWQLNMNFFSGCDPLSDPR